MNFLVPTAHAAADMTAFQNVLSPVITNVIMPIVYFMFALAVVVFAFGVAQVIWKGEDPESRQKGKNSMVFGVIGIFIMVSAWGIIYLISNTLKTL